MGRQSFIYNSDEANPNVNNPFRVTKPSLIRAAGLEEEVQVYFAAGRCIGCSSSDYLWSPVMICGQPLTISPENNHVVLEIPGKYSLGDPNAPTPLELTGDVNITLEENIRAYQLPRVCGTSGSDTDDCDPAEARGVVDSWG